MAILKLLNGCCHIFNFIARHICCNIENCSILPVMIIVFDWYYEHKNRCIIGKIVQLFKCAFMLVQR